MSTKRCFDCTVKASALAAILLFAAGTLRSDDGFDALFPQEGPIVRERVKQITAEFATLDRATLKDDDWAKEWAGSYHAGDGLISNRSIRIAPKTGVAYTSSGCLGLYDVNYGEIVETFPGGIKVKLERDPQRQQDKFMSATLYFVRWGNERYLVPESRMQKFVANYNAGGASRDRMHDIPRRVPEGESHRGHRIAPPGRPQLPAEFAALIIERPTRLKITSVELAGGIVLFENGSVSHARGKVELEGGRDRGLFVGTEIDCAGPLRTGLIYLDEVDDTRSRGTFSLSSRDKSSPLLEAGSEVLLPGAQPESPATK